MMIRWMIYLGLLIFAAYESVVFEDAAVTMFFVEKSRQRRLVSIFFVA